MCKTTTEGYIILKQWNDSITNPHEQPLAGADIYKTKSGYHKIYYDWVKWYDEFPSVDNFSKGLTLLESHGIPYKFIRLGEETDDVEVIENYTDDMPDELCDFNPEVTVYDPNDDSEYESIK